MLARDDHTPLENHPLCMRSTSPAAARWCRSPATTCRCSTQPACSGNIYIQERPPALFDVSHMGQEIALRAKSGHVGGRGIGAGTAGAAGPSSASPPAGSGYAQFTNDDGGNSRRI